MYLVKQMTNIYLRMSTDFVALSKKVSDDADLSP